MDDNELHYLSYDADAIMEDMMRAYIEAGGDLIYAGDEKEMLLRAVQQIIVQAFAGIDNALRMDTLRYAVRDYLDAYGEKRSCERILAQAATATVKITMSATGVATTIEAGTILTADGAVLYRTTEDLTANGYAQELTATIECMQEGSVGNALTAGMEMQPLVPIDGAESVVCLTSATGGQDKEEDDVYRERIRTFGLTRVSTGPQQQYESAAMAVSSEVVDARALNMGAGQVGVFIITESDTGIQALLQAIEEALSDKTMRPLTDQVSVSLATAKPYTLNVQYAFDGSASAQTAIGAAAAEYQAWQDRSIGRAFNPEKLAAMLYQAGATRVIWGEGSAFGTDGDVAYTEIGSSEYCKGTISLAVMSA